MADPAAERLERLVQAFQTTYVPPLLAGLTETVVEFYLTEDEARARTVDVMVDQLASRLPMYTQLRDAFRTIPLATIEASNLEVGLMPFANPDSDDAFKALVKCCYTKIVDPKDCTKFTPKGFYAVYNRNTAVDPTCIQGVIGMMNAILVKPTDADCEKYKDLLEAQQTALAVGGGGGGGVAVGGARRSRHRRRRGRKGTRRH
jgi:hypothetical protein